MKIKISEISHLTDARYFAAREVDYIGFNRLTTRSSDIKTIEDWIFGPQVVSEFIGDTNLDDIQRLLTKHKTDVLHFDYYTDKKVLSDFSEFELFLDIDYSIINHEAIIRKMELLASSIDYFVIKSFENLDKNIEYITQLSSEFPCFIDVKFDIYELDKIINLNPEGIILRGSDEERVGVKSFEQLDDIFDILDDAI